MYEAIQVGASFSKTITMETEICCNCGIPFALPSDLRSNLLNDPDKWFYCPNGHKQCVCVCSCCNRSFINLAEHIKSQHPELVGKEKTKRKTNKNT